MAVVPPLTQLAVLAVKGKEEWAFLFTDDAYYYFGVARNIAAGNGSTFSGLVETNGYHPLWLLALTAVGFVLRGDYSFLFGVALLQTALWIGCVRQAVLIGRRLGSEALGLAGMVGLGFLGVITGQLSFNGMESAPLLFLLLLALRLTLDLDEDDPRQQRHLGIVFALVCLTRLDAAATVGALAVVVAARGRPLWPVLRSRAVRLLGPSATALAAYLLVNAVAFGSLTPVSGRAKSLGAPFWNRHPVEQFLKAGQYGEQPLWFGVVTLTGLAFALMLRDWRITPAGRRLVAGVAALLVGQAFLLGYLTVATSYRIWAWYHYNLAVLAFCAAILLANSAMVRLSHSVVRVCVALGLAFVAAQVPATFDSGVNHSHRAIEVAQFIDEDLPPDAVLAMGDRAGLVGYLADRPLLQTEGLMADVEWLHDLENGTAMRRMVAEGVDYFVWSGVIGGRPTESTRGSGCRELAEPRAGNGPKFWITVCFSDLVFHTGEGHDQFNVFRFNGPDG